ncbi:accessory gene regulator ArgB-like protein [Brassicibacter mesophilus]|uniref:accessory gene regulator ArgB-like protein n=1 Tax=Brassicibacter mesophilus TaxID=745119 RepID=UPI003D25B534
MINQMASYVVNIMKRNNTIDEKEMDLYVFGMEVLLITSIKGIGLFIIAFALGLLKEAIAFILAFSMLRMQAGGVHLESFWKCFIVTNIITFFSIYLVIFLPINHTIIYQIIILAVSIILTILYSPVDTPNKPLNEEETKLYKKRSLFVILIGSVIIIILSLFSTSFIVYGNIASFGFLCEGITLTPLVAKKKIDDLGGELNEREN